MTNDKLYSTRRGRFSIGYDDPDETPGDMGGWFLSLSGQMLTAEYNVSASTARAIIDDFDLERTDDGADDDDGEEEESR